MNHLLGIFGFGYTAQQFAKLYQKSSFQIIGTSRQPEKLTDFNHPSCQIRGFSAKTFEELEIQPTQLLISTPPTEEGDPTLIEFEEYLAKMNSRIQTIIYLSTTGVYGDHQGAWVDESTAPHRPGINAKRRLEAEKSWLDFSSKHQIPLYIFRLAGIYGPHRNALQLLKKGKEFSVFKKDLVFSRIHVEDICQSIIKALLHPEKAGIYNLSDNEPAPNTDIDVFAAKLLGVKAPPHLSFEEANLTALGLEFYQSNKRVSNRMLVEKLGIELHYPSYHEGLSALYNQEQY